MLDEKDLQAIGQLMDTKIKEAENRMRAYVEADAVPEYDMLLERRQFSRKALSLTERIRNLEDEVRLMKRVIVSMAHDIEDLKKAQ